MLSLVLSILNLVLPRLPLRIPVLHLVLSLSRIAKPYTALRFPVLHLVSRSKFGIAKTYSCIQSTSFSSAKFKLNSAKTYTQIPSATQRGKHSSRSMRTTSARDQASKTHKKRTTTVPRSQQKTHPHRHPEERETTPLKRTTTPPRNEHCREQ